MKGNILALIALTMQFLHDDDDLVVIEFLCTLSIYESKESLPYPIRGVKYIRRQVRPGIKHRASLHNFSKNTRKRDVRERIARTSEIFASRRRHSARARVITNGAVLRSIIRQ